MNVMVEDLASIAPKEQREIDLEERAPDMLLFDLLQELIYYKDAEQLLLRIEKLNRNGERGIVPPSGERGRGETRPWRHEQRADVKAVTLHRLRLEKTGRRMEGPCYPRYLNGALRALLRLRKLGIKKEQSLLSGTGCPRHPGGLTRAAFVTRLVSNAHSSGGEMMEKKILVIDDEEGFCQFVKHCLERTGRFDVFRLYGRCFGPPPGGDRKARN